MEREEFIQRSSEYALGMLHGKELHSFEEYLSTASREEREILAGFTATASLLPLALERSTPPPNAKQQLMQKIALSARARDAVQRRSANDTTVRRTTNWIPFGVAAALGMVVIFSFFVIKLLGTIEQQNNELSAGRVQNQQLQERLVAVQDELSRRNEQLKILSAKEIHVSIMNGLKANPIGYGKVIWDPDRGTAILQVSNLPAVSSTKDYQLWVIKGKTPISAGVFAVNDSTSNFFKIENLAVTNPKEIAAFAITLEPKGGMPQPTGDMYMMGTPAL